MVRIRNIKTRAASVFAALVFATIATCLYFTCEKNVRLRGSADRVDSLGVRNYSTDSYNCMYLLPFSLSDGSLSRICTYDPDYDYISWNIKVWNSWERPLVEDTMRALAAAQHLLWNKTQAGDKTTKVSLVDLGSNIGVFTLTAASAGYEVLAVDPMEESVQLLATTLNLAGLTSRVTILNNAISDVRGSVSMQADDQNMGGAYVKQKNRFGEDSGDEANIRAICMNDLIPYVRSRHVVIKMDIEHFEELALWSAGDFFENVDVYSVLMDWTSHRSDSGLAIIQFMARRELKPYADSLKTQALNTSSYLSWPDNIVFIR